MQPHSENAMSVKEIVTEIESISQGVGQIQVKGDVLSNPCHTPKKHIAHELPLERAQAATSRPGNLEQSEGSCSAQPEPAKDSGKGHPEGCPGAHSTAEVEEEEPAEGEQEPWGPGMPPGAKWCPGSVRRATLEFEERLRQEQEHHGAGPAGPSPSSLSSLSSRKNSRSDSLVADPAARGKSDEATPELSYVPKEPETSRAQGRCGGSEAGSLPRPEQLAIVPAPELRESHPAPAPQDGPRHEGVLREPRAVVSGQGPETPAAPAPFPKKIEIIEYTYTAPSPDPRPGRERASSEKSGAQGLRTVKVEEALTVLCALDENLNRTLSPDQAPLCPRVLPPPHSPSPQQSRPADLPPTLSSPAEPDVSPTTQPCGASPDHLRPQTVIHLEGFTGQSSTTDSAPSTEQGSREENREGPLSRGGEVPYQGSQFSSEDLHLISQLGDNTGEQPVKRDPTPVAHQLPHSSSTDSIESLSQSPRVGKGRAKEIESRATSQVGPLKPPQMRRSASLAKLGYLDLCKDCSPEREPVSSESPHLKLLQPFLRTDSGMEAQEPPENPDTAQNREPTKYFIEQLRTTGRVVQSRPVQRPLVQYAKEFGYSQQCLLPRAGPELTSSEGGLPSVPTQGLQDTGPAPGLAVAPRQQHGRTHPLRRLRKANDKKRTTNPFYNTM